MTPLADWVPDLDDRSTTAQRIDTIAFTPMPVRLRNELITQAYGDIAEAMGSVIGTDIATWSNLGVWASNSIGSWLALPVPVVGSAISRPFADGNRDVFADVGRAHVAFLDTVGSAHLAGQPVGPAWRECQRRLAGHQVEPPGNAAGDNFELWDTLTPNDTRQRGRPGSRLLRLGFEAYARSLRLDGDERAHAILLGNVLLAIHEQRLLSVAISVGFRSWVRTVTSFPHPLRSQHEWATRRPHDWHIALENRWIHTATRHLVGIDMPGTTVKVSRSVPPGDTPVNFQPLDIDVATGLTAGASHVESLSQIYAAIDVTGEAVSCWNDQKQRMRYITALFEQQQSSDRWFDPGGNVVRPDPWRRFERSAATQTAAMRAPIPPSISTDTECPLSDDFLDELRAKPSHPQLSGAALLTFEAIRDTEQRLQLMGEIETDSAQRLAAIVGPGGLLSPQVCRRSRTMYRQWNVMMLMGLLFRSLPHDYAAARGVKVLGAISSLGTDSLRRAGETAHFVRDLLMSDDGWESDTMVVGGDAMTSVVGVRCLHSIVSGHLIDAEWDSATNGVPVNQEDVLGTALSFAIPPFEMMAALGLTPSTEVRNAYTSFWLGIGHLLGAPIEALTTVDDDGNRVALTYEQGRAVTAAIRRRHHSRSLDGVRLTEALMTGVGDGFPRGFSWLATGMMRTLGDPAVNATLLAHLGPGRRRAAVISCFLRVGLRVRLTRRVTRWFVQTIGNRWLRPFLDAGVRRPYRSPARHMRDGPQAGSSDIDVWPFGC